MMFKIRRLILGTLILLLITGCSQNIEKEIVGTWQAINEDCDTNMGSKITFYDDNTIAGIEGYQEYKIEETNHDDFDYAVLSGGYEDVAKYRVKVNDDNLNIVYEEEDIYDFDSAIACHMERVND